MIDMTRDNDSPERKFNTKLRPVGNSLGIIIPKKILDEKNIKEGDEITIQLILEDNQIKEVRFSGQGCAISQASTSMLTDKIKKMDIEEIKCLNKDDVLEMLHIPISPGRLKCALLSLDTLRGALENA